MSVPVIMYTYQSVAEIKPDLPTIKSLGVNVVMNYYFNIDPSISTAIAMLDDYVEAGLKGLMRLGNFTQKVMDQADYDLLGDFVTALKDHPGLYGWYTYDEPTDAFPVPQLETVKDFIISKGSDHPQAIVYPGYGPLYWPDITPVAYPQGPENQDFFGVDTYPINSSGNYQIPNQENSLAGFTTALEESFTATDAQSYNNLFFVLQTYVEGTTPGPSATQLSDMAAAAESTGWTSRGISLWMWHWGYGTPGDVRSLKENPAAWDAIRTITEQYNNRIYTILNGESDLVYSVYDGKVFSQDGISYYRGVSDDDAVGVDAIGLTAY